MCENSEGLLREWIKNGTWMTCEVQNNVFKISKRKEQPKNEERELDDDFFGLSLDDETKSNSVVIPLAQGEKFCNEPIDTAVKTTSKDKAEVILLESEFSCDNNLSTSSHENGKLVPLFISHILCSKEQGKCLKLGTLYFQSVIIYGTVIGVQTKPRNSLLIDDGTAEIMCYVENNLNNDLSHKNNCKVTVNSPYYEMFQIFETKSRKYECLLPSFDEINIGDKLMITGKVSLYKGGHYLFVNNLERPKNINSHINFMEDVFNLFETSYYDFNDSSPTIK